jgi:hypothetical protein
MQWIADGVGEIDCARVQRPRIGGQRHLDVDNGDRR